jgi:hypothetical protein
MLCSCVDRKSSEIGLEGVGTGYIQTDAAINQVYPGLLFFDVAQPMQLTF